MERRSGRDRRQPPAEACRLLLIWTSGGPVTENELAITQGAVMEAAAAMGLTTLVTPRQLDWDTPTAADRDCLSRCHGLVWVVGSDGHLNPLLTRSALDRDIPLLRITMRPEDCNAYTELGLAAMGLDELPQPQGTVADLQHFLTRAQRRLQAPSTDAMANLHTVQGRLAEGLRRERPHVSYAATWRSLLEQRVSGDESTSRGIRVSFDRYVEAAARVAWHLQHDGMASAASIQEPPPQHSMREAFRGDLTATLQGHLSELEVPEQARPVWLSPMDRGLDPLPINSTQAYACLRLWRTRELLERTKGGVFVGGRHLPRGDTDADVAKRFFTAAIRLYTDLLESAAS